MQIQSVKLILTVIVTLLLVTLACGEAPGVPRQLGGSDGSSVLLPPSSSSSASASTSGSGQVSAGNSVQIELKDFELSPADLLVTAGEVTFTLVNAGRYTHDFRIEGEDFDEKSPRVGIGRTDEWSVTLAPGEYVITCPISNHVDRGMVGTLTVVP